MLKIGKKLDLKSIIISLLVFLVVVSTVFAVKGYFFTESELLPFEVRVESLKPRYKTSEVINLLPQLIYKGKKPIDITTGGNIFFFRILDENGFKILEDVNKLVDIHYHRLEPGTSYNDLMLYRMRVYPYTSIYPGVFKPGKYRVIVWADFTLGKFEKWEERPPEVKVSAEHIFIEIVEP